MEIAMNDLEKNSVPVLLSITGKNRAMQDGEEMDAIKLMTTGMLTQKDDGWQLDYDEMDPDGGARQRIRLVMKGGRVSMQRRGEYGTTMVFEKDRRFEGFYHTPYGDLRMGVYATRVHWKVERGQGTVDLQYQLDLQGGFSAVHDLNLRFAQNG